MHLLNEYNLQRGIQMSLESLQAQGQVRQAPVYGVAIHEPDSAITRILLDVEGKGKGIVSDEQAAQSLLDLHKPKKQNSTNDADIEILNVKEVQGEEVSHIVALEERTGELDEGQAGS
ncbi:hypothetical protein Tco_0330759, partial [Tanacetum coccineum]